LIGRADGPDLLAMAIKPQQLRFVGSTSHGGLSHKGWPCRSKDCEVRLREVLNVFGDGTRVPGKRVRAQIEALRNQGIITPVDQVARIDVGDIGARVHDDAFFVRIQRAEQNHVVIEAAGEIACKVEEVAAVW
jgi:hypothetical protein